MALRIKNRLNYVHKQTARGHPLIKGKPAARVYAHVSNYGSTQLSGWVAGCVHTMACAHSMTLLHKPNSAPRKTALCNTVNCTTKKSLALGFQVCGGVQNARSQPAIRCACALALGIKTLPSAFFPALANL